MYIISYTIPYQFKKLAHNKRYVPLITKFLECQEKIVPDTGQFVLIYLFFEA